MSIAQTSQLLQLVLNSAVMMIIALAWWGVVVFRLNTVSNQMQRLRRQRQSIQADEGRHRLRLRLRQHRHTLTVRYRLSRHSALIMHYVLLAQIASLFLLSLRALVNSNVLITAALFLAVSGAAGILLSVILALMEFYHMHVLMPGEPDWIETRPSPSAMSSVAPQYQVVPHPQGQVSISEVQVRHEESSHHHSMGAIAG